MCKLGFFLNLTIRFNIKDALILSPDEIEVIQFLTPFFGFTKEYHDFYKALELQWQQIESQKKEIKTNSSFKILRRSYTLLVVVFMTTLFMPYIWYTSYWDWRTTIFGITFHFPIGWVGIALILLSLGKIYYMKTASSFKLGLVGWIIITLNYLWLISLFYDNESKLYYGFYLGLSISSFRVSYLE